MIRYTYDREVARIENDLMSFGHQVRISIPKAVKALERKDFSISRDVIQLHSEIRRKKTEIEMSSLKLIATQQPMASDLRTLASIITVASELERIYEYAKGIGKINLLIGAQPYMKPITDLPVMAYTADDMLLNGLTAFSRRDVALARSIPPQDDVVDQLYNQIFNDIIEIVVEKRETFEQVNYLMWAAHNVERAADRVVNICERIIFMVTGELISFENDPSHDIDLNISSIS